jgi:hypothetical protein
MSPPGRAKGEYRPQKPCSPVGRALQIGLAFAGFVLWWGWHRGLMRCDDHPVAERFATLLQGLGTTFVKLGQHLSLRADLVPDAAQHALARLQDHVGPFPSEQALRAVESAFGRTSRTRRGPSRRPTHRWAFSAISFATADSPTNGQAPMSYHVSKTVAMDFEAAVDKVTAELKARGFGILPQIDRDAGKPS